MAYTQADLDAVESAIASGTKLVRFGDRVREFRTVDELLKAKADILADLNAPGDTPATRSRSIRVRGTAGRGVF